MIRVKLLLLLTTNARTSPSSIDVVHPDSAVSLYFVPATIVGGVALVMLFAATGAVAPASNAVYEHFQMSISVDPD